MKRKTQKILRSAKLRCTGPRKIILGALMDAGRPQTAEQIAAKLGPACPDKVTIYRTLESFVEAGFVHRAFINERSQHFEMADHCSSKQCHPHFVCNGCGKTQCLIGQRIVSVKAPRGGFVVQRQQVRLEGLCPSCSELR